MTTQKTSVTNITQGYRGLHTVDGELMLNPGQHVESIEITAAERKSAEGTGYFEFDAKAPAAPAPAASTGDELPRNVAKLKKIARDEGIDLGNASKADDVIAAITAARAAKAGGGIPPSTPPSDDLDNMADDDLRTTVAALTGKPVSDYATTEREQLLKLARGE